MDIPERVVKRVLSKVAMGPRGCHISTYSVASHGYAQVGWHEDGERIVTLCHRVIWTWFRGAIPDGMTVDHMCKNRRCIRLQHLRLISNLENARRTSGRDWPLGQCVNGHSDAEYWVPKAGRGGKGFCLRCKTEAREQWLAIPGNREREREIKNRSQRRRRAMSREVA